MSPLKATGPNSHRRLRVLDVILESDAPLKSAEIKISTNNGLVIHREEKTLEYGQIIFHVSRDLQPAGLLLQMKCSYGIMKKTIDVKGEDLLGDSEHCNGEEQAWKHSFGKLELAIGFQVVSRTKEVCGALQDADDQWIPITDKILGICPRFRVLVIGKSGAGKSALINKVFGVTSTKAEYHDHAQSGQFDINHEIRSENNPYFLLHDGPHFEHGGDGAVDIIQNFIKRRSQRHDIKEKLHAVWVCVEIPTACSRLMEPGIEKFLKLKVAGELGQVPVIVIFTKFDRLVGMEMRKAGFQLKSSMAKDQFNMAKDQFNVANQFNMAKKRANTRFLRECIFPFRALLADRAIPFVSISIYPQYQASLNELTNLTFTSVEQYCRETAVVMGISQKVNASVKIQICVKLGVENYWRAPEVAPSSSSEAVHTDIVNVWNLNDDHKLLHSPKFKELLNSLEYSKEYSPNRIIAGYMSVLRALVIIVPFHRRANLQRTLYALNLMLVMQNLFWIQNLLATQARKGGSGDRSRTTIPITRRLIKLAFKLYCDADYRNDLLNQVDGHTSKTVFCFQGGATATIKKAIRWIYSSTNETDIRYHSDVFKIFKSYTSAEPEEDEPWESPVPTPISDTSTADRRPAHLEEMARRIRVLITGRANAGKTTILKKICDTIDDPAIYNTKGEMIGTSIIEPTAQRGLHDIEDEMVFRSNPVFIFHDSRGFEAGGVEEFVKVKSFLSARARAKDPADRIDVIWYCISMDDDRPIQFAENKIFSELGTGKVPIVVVFTRCEALEFKAFEILEEQGYSFEEALENGEKYAKENLQTLHLALEKKKYPPQGHVYLQELEKPENHCQELLDCTAMVLGHATLHDLTTSMRRGSLGPAAKPGVTSRSVDG